MPAHKKHGIVYTPTYSSWIATIHRCYSSKAKAYPAYGAVGIKCCEFIRASPLSLVMLIGHRPDTDTEKYTIDRIKNELGYYCGQCAECLENEWPLNVRWATRTEQARNQTKNKWIVINGVKQCQSQWAKESGISVVTLFNRIKKGWPSDRVLSAPIRKTTNIPKMIEIDGVTKNLTQWAKYCGITQCSFAERIEKGLTGKNLIRKKGEPVI